MDIEKVVAHYVSLREQVKEMEAELKERTAPLKEAMTQIEAALQKMLQDQGLESMKTGAGTAYISKTERAKIEDWNTVLSFIQEHDTTELLERRINATALKDLRDAGTEVPGVSLNTFTKVNVRRS